MKFDLIRTSFTHSPTFPGVFNAKYEDARTGRVWQGVIKYVIGALVEMSDAPPEHKLLVSPHQE